MEKKLDIPFVFISQPYFKVSKIVKLNARHDFIMKIPNKKKKIQQIASSDIEFKDFMKLSKDDTKEPF